MKSFYKKHLLTQVLMTICSFTGIHSFSQTTLVAGDIAFTGYVGSDATLSDQFSFVLLKNISSGTVIYFTDRGWRPNLLAFDTGAETVITFSSTSAINAGKEILIVTGAATAAISGGGTAGTLSDGGVPLSLASSGDQILAFQGSLASPAFISGIHMNVYCTACTGDPTNTDAANWDGANLSGPYAPNPNTSGKPAALTTGVNAIWIGTTGVQASEKDNARFNCSGDLTTATGVRTAIYAGVAPNTFSNWTTSDVTAGFTMPPNCVYFSTPAPAITLQPTLQNKCSGTSANFTVNASNATSYQWESAPSPFTTWTSVNTGGVYTVVSGSGTTTLSISNVTGLDGRQFRCIATGSTAPAATSNGALLTVYALPSLTNATTAATCTGTSPNITLTASVPSSFAWTLGANTGAITGASASSGAAINQVLTNPSPNTVGSIVYNVTPTSTTGSCPGSPSPITVSVNFATGITQHPVNTGVCAGGGTTTFSITAIGTGIAYSWQADIGLGFQTINNSSIFSNATTATLTITNPTPVFNGAIFRGVATGTCGVANSNVATLVIDPAGLNTWTGKINNTWENAGNWRCGTIPDASTDVLIPANSIVTLNSDRSCRTLTVRPTANFTVKSGFRLTTVR